MPKGVYDNSYPRGFRIPRETRICECGCEETFECKINSKKRFVRGHNSQGQIPTKEVREKLRIAAIR